MRNALTVAKNVITLLKVILIIKLQNIDGWPLMDAKN